MMRLRSIVNPPKVDELPRGIPIQCGDLECIFEFKIYQYIGRYTNDPDHPESPSPFPSQDNNQTMMEDNESLCTPMDGDDEVIFSPTTGLPTNATEFEAVGFNNDQSLLRTTV